ncbi:hypothetical protein ACYOEI_38415, partial [Singulisphaera rosea]
ATMVGAQLHGGLVLGAFLPNGEAVGLSFAFLGRAEGRICLYSQLTGIVPGQQSRGLGYQLKQAQREYALDEGVDLIAWAFDPLQAGNARFNLDKLGATAARYVDDMYGPRTDALNTGVPTDRLIAEWELSSPHPRLELESAEILSLPRLINSDDQPGGVRVATGLRRAVGSRALLEIPEDITALRSLDPQLADTWRRAVREGFITAFASGYRAVGFLRDESEGRQRRFYVLQIP